MMLSMRLLSRVVALATIVLLTACGGAGGNGSGDVFPKADPGPSVAVGLDRFLLFPNPLVEASGAYETDTPAYAQAYYAAIDPTNAKDTLAKWKAANNFDSGTGTQVSVVFGDVRDLGYGRRLTVRQNVDGTVAAYVENYLVNAVADYVYSTVNLEAAVAGATQYHIGTNAIEFSPDPAGVTSFAKFFTFTPAGVRSLTADLDGRGDKTMPGPCVSCHGGRADPLTPPSAGGNPLFALVQYAVSGARGDLQGRMHALEADALDFSATPGFTRAEQEAAIKAINRMVLCTYPISAATGFAEDACRRIASPNEWQGTAANQIKAAYGGDGLPNSNYLDIYFPPSWAAAGQSSLYSGVVAPACRACHALRGTGRQSDIDFDTYSGWAGYADRIKVGVFARGIMPLARLVYQKFHGSNMPATLAAFLQEQGIIATTASGAPLTPGRPIADPGPDRVVPQGAVLLSANMSLFASTYQWTLVSGPAGATLTNASSAQPTFTSIADGTYVLELVASNATLVSDPAQLRIVVNNALIPAPSAVRFSQIKQVLQGALAPATNCTSAGCHTAGGGAPLFYSDYDRNGDGATDSTDDLWFYTEVRGRINFTDIAASPLLRKPSGHHHGGGANPIAGFDTTLAPGQTGRAHYDLFVNWISNGAPQ
jgi:mono/diheme cytochrome c family protein